MKKHSSVIPKLIFGLMGAVYAGAFACHVFRRPLSRVEGSSTRTRKPPGGN